MIYLTLHQTQSDYDSLVLDESNIPHVAYIVDTGVVYCVDVDGPVGPVTPTDPVPEGYQTFKMGDEELIDSEGNKFLVIK